MDVARRRVKWPALLRQFTELSIERDSIRLSKARPSKATAKHVNYPGLKAGA